MPHPSRLAFLAGLVLASLAPAPFAEAQLENGSTTTGTIAPFQVDTYYVTATEGDTILLHIGQLDVSDFVPWIQLLNPGGGLIASDWGAVAASIERRAPETGLYTIVVKDNSASGQGGQMGDYALHFARTGDPPIEPGPERGPVLNGAVYQGSIGVGDLDVYQIHLDPGDSLIAYVGDTDLTDLTPEIRIFAPDGLARGSDYGPDFAFETISPVLTQVGGIYTIAVSDAGSLGHTGDYTLEVAKLPGVLTLTSDEGGVLTDGGAHAGFVGIGDFDVWTLGSAAGSTITIEIDEVAPGPLVPWVRLYNPDGSPRGGSTSPISSWPAFVTGRYTVVVAHDSGSARIAQTGAYEIRYSSTGDLPLSVCDNGFDDDGDRHGEYPTDPGCFDAASAREAPQCQDGLNNDAETGIDFDGGAALDLNLDGFVDATFNPDTPAVGDPDPQCVDKPWRNSEKPSCGLGAELALALPLLAALRRRRQATCCE